jgi:hypothetical protein
VLNVAVERSTRAQEEDPDGSEIAITRSSCYRLGGRLLWDPILADENEACTLAEEGVRKFAPTRACQRWALPRRALIDEDEGRSLMTPDELRAIMSYLRERVSLETGEAGGGVTILFETPTCDEMIQAGLDPEGSREILQVPWWEEMVTDVVETPDMCDAGDPPEQVLEYARDVVSEYIRKRFEL